MLRQHQVVSIESWHRASSWPPCRLGLLDHLCLKLPDGSEKVLELLVGGLVFVEEQNPQNCTIDLFSNLLFRFQAPIRPARPIRLVHVNSWGHDASIINFYHPEHIIQDLSKVR
jgi:hypothetical protein